MNHILWRLVDVLKARIQVLKDELERAELHPDTCHLAEFYCKKIIPLQKQVDSLIALIKGRYERNKRSVG